MDFKEYQKEARKTAIYMKGFEKKNPGLKESIYRIVALSYVANGLGEVGEIQGKVKKIIRDDLGVITDQHRKDLSKEIGDVLWYVSNMCTELDLDLEEVAKQNVEKLFDRKKRGVIRGSGDDR